VSALWLRPNLTTRDVHLLKCPKAHCTGQLTFRGSLGAPIDGSDDQPLGCGTLDCGQCGSAWPVQWGCPELIEPGSVSGTDWLLRPIYDLIAPSHDFGVDCVLPLLQYPDPDGARERYIERMELAALEPRADPIRILEVGIGAGANLPLLQRHLPLDVDVEFWGLDLSRGMLLQCALRADWWYFAPQVRLVLGDAHNLPFQSNQFDRVFHVGAINGYRDPKGALAEMARVARPRTPIVVVDEELDPAGNHSLLHRIAFHSLTWFDTNPRAPKNLVPAECLASAQVTRVSRFYYCLTFQKP
jgi:ubiquinone/menaquinone biosynthesis C-methylase UbiE